MYRAIKEIKMQQAFLQIVLNFVVQLSCNIVTMNRQWQHHSRGNQFFSHSSIGKQVNTCVLACLPTKIDNLYLRELQRKEKHSSFIYGN